jgi:hypothetical protein
MKQHQMTHKFRDNEAEYNNHSPPHVSSGSLHVTTTSMSSGLSKSPGSSPMTSPPCSQSMSPPAPTFTSAGVKRPQEDVGVSLVDRPPEKRAILCG